MEEMANRLLIEENLSAQGWRFAWDKATTRFGVCKYRSKTVGVSKSNMATESWQQMEDTLRHEIAHALTPPGIERAHGPVWRSHAIRLGAKPKASARVSDATKREKAQSAKWVIVCPIGKIVSTYQRTPPESTFRSLKIMYARGRKAQTIGKLRLIPVAQYEMEFGQMT